MTKTIQIRGVPDEVHRELRSRAALAGTSLSDYLLGEMTRVASHSRVAEVLKRAEERDWGVSSEEIVAAVRAGREDD